MKEVLDNLDNLIIEVSEVSANENRADRKELLDNTIAALSDARDSYAKYNRLEREEEIKDAVISPIYDQPKDVLMEYAAYVHGKIQMNEVPFVFEDWAAIELQEQSPVSIKIGYHFVHSASNIIPNLKQPSA